MDVLLEILLLAVGLFLVFYLLYEVLFTIVGEGGAPLSIGMLRAHNWLWQRPDGYPRGYPRRRPPSWLGMVQVVTGTLLWFLILWVGWLVAFCSHPDAVLDTATGEPAPFLSRVYFSGFLISTLGVGDYSPGEGLWQPLAAFASLTGLYLITLTIAIYVPIIQQAMFRHQAALRISYLGTTPQSIALKLYDTERREINDSRLENLVDDLIQLEQNTRQFPALHWYGSSSQRESAALAVARLDEALNLLELGLGAKPTPEYESARRAIRGFLNTLDEAGMRIAQDDPGPPTTAGLHGRNLPVEGDEVFREKLREVGERRRRLLTVVLCGGWKWEDLECRPPGRDSESRTKNIR